MTVPEYPVFYERHLPHFQPEGATIFVTFRLAGSLPIKVLQILDEEKRLMSSRIEKIADPGARREAITKGNKLLFGRWDSALGSSKTGNNWLSDTKVAEIVWEAIHGQNGIDYVLDACCIMPNHVHMVITPLKIGEGYKPLSEIMQSLKGKTSRQANIILGRNGQFWQHESYDHVVRDDNELGRIVNYVVDNPSRAGLPAVLVYSKVEAT